MRTQAAATQAVCLAWSYVEEVYQAFEHAHPSNHQQTANFALERMSLAARQLARAHELDPTASPEAKDRNGRSYSPTQDEMRAEMLKIEGVARRLLGETRTAVGLLQKAVSYAPDNPSVHSALADAYLDLGYKQPALTAAKRAAELSRAEMDFLKQADEIDHKSAAAINIAAFKGSWGKLACLGIVTLLLVLTNLGRVDTAVTALIFGAVLIGSGILYWNWRR